MDIITLKVFNSLYNLNITEPEFEDIERELKDKDKTGIYIAAIKDGKSICVSHDEQKHRIVIEKIQNQKIRIMPKSRILFKTLITFKNIPEEIFTLHRIAQYKARDNEIKFTAHNLEAIKNRICNRFADGYPKELGGVYDDVFSSANNRKNAKKKKPVLVVKQLAALFWLFDEKYVEHDYPSRLNIARIIKVWQRKNMRIALFQENECWTINRSGLCYNYEDVDRVTYRIKTYTPKDSRFNYVCPNREIGLTQNSDYIELWLDDDLFEKVSPPELEIIQKIIRNENKTGEWKLLNADKFNNLRRQIRTEGRLTRRSKELKEAEQTLKKNIKKQFNNGKVVRLGITFAKNFFSYEGIIIKGDDMDSYIVKNNIMLLERPDFNNIFFGYIEHLLDIRTVHNYYPYSREIYFMRGEKCFKAGKIKVKVIAETRRITINSFRIAKDEVEEILKRVINYNTQKEYDTFLENTQRVSLKLNKVLKQGYFKFPEKMDKTDDCCLEMPEDEMNIAIPVIRKDNKNFINVKNKQYPIKNIQSLFKLQYPNGRTMWHYEGSYLQRTIVQLHKAVNGITSDDIGILISDGVKEYRKQLNKEQKELKKRIAKSKEFIAHAVKLTNAVKVDKGYFVYGISKIKYFVAEDDLGVWTVKNNKQDKYLCIIDIDTDTDNQAGKNDAIAKRLLMLSKDKVVASEIFQNGDRMDSHWLEIQDNPETNSGKPY